MERSCHAAVMDINRDIRNKPQVNDSGYNEGILFV